MRNFGHKRRLDLLRQSFRNKYFANLEKYIVDIGEQFRNNSDNEISIEGGKDDEDFNELVAELDYGDPVV